jgi:hypothetical protein
LFLGIEIPTRRQLAAFVKNHSNAAQIEQQTQTDIPEHESLLNVLNHPLGAIYSFNHRCTEKSSLDFASKILYNTNNP